MCKRDTTGWECQDWYDLIPEPGSFVSYAPKQPYTMPAGIVVEAFNYVHAEYLWVKRVIEASGEEWGKCCLCNQNIRYAVMFTDPEGKYHHTGQDCAGFVISGLKDKPEWFDKRLLADIAETKTKNGIRYRVTFECPSWWWNINKTERPSWSSLFKGQPDRGGRCKWYLTIWGEQRGDVISNFEKFKVIRLAHTGK